MWMYVYMNIYIYRLGPYYNFLIEKTQGHPGLIEKKTTWSHGPSQPALLGELALMRLGALPCLWGLSCLCAKTHATKLLRLRSVGLRKTALQLTTHEARAHMHYITQRRLASDGYNGYQSPFSRGIYAGTLR